VATRPGGKRPEDSLSLPTTYFVSDMPQWGQDDDGTGLQLRGGGAEIQKSATKKKQKKKLDVSKLALPALEDKVIPMASLSKRDLVSSRTTRVLFGKSLKKKI
jgi:hypothetical protein